ncbi:Cytochrome c oxidase subunit 5B, mitochondrial [Lodderomyces elongisporus]|uniref:Cytochrome c oxidase subunit 5B, mitochondrial n=1 Tax=Lodderomyces elongisporus TaxID=36914 RepID=UPI0029236636|nr:Cytochrome c oxidase subunit 5B, mitochondrial [Lodderomyces elongisporus]WLF76609.1 Cytochrome c oxidase subunit 5B, mitochondrial [Lodderomyces elongisporus]
MSENTLVKQSIRLNSTVAKSSAPRALSNAYIGKLESRWTALPKEDQNTLIEELKARMELPWQELTSAEKKAAYYISFGEWGPRRPLYAPGEKSRIFQIVAGSVVGSFLLFFGIKAVSAPLPQSMEREWMEASDEYLKSKNANPFTGYSQIQ